MSSIAVAVKFADENHYAIDANQEFIAFGLANLSGSFFQSFPVSGMLHIGQ